MNKSKLLILGAAVLLLTGCADTVTFAEAMSIEPVGFWHGVWHGWTSFIALIGSLFDDSIAVYAIYNNGGWYDFGFLIGAGSIFGGGSCARRSK